MRDDPRHHRQLPREPEHAESTPEMFRLSNALVTGALGFFAGRASAWAQQRFWKQHGAQPAWRIHRRHHQTLRRRQNRQIKSQQEAVWDSNRFSRQWGTAVKS
jgi:hypothetical protein